jgi:mannitol operon transcriptional antiterminator
VQVFSPRLGCILTMLLDSGAPVPARDMAERLGVSRRTVFRELEGVDAALGGYGLKLGTSSGKGVALEGGGAARGMLADDLESAGSFGHSGPLARRLRLALWLALRPGPHKLFFWADFLGVSVSTVSVDMERLEPRLAERGLSLSRCRQGGAAAEGGELARRVAAMSFLAGLEALGLKGDRPLAGTDRLAAFPGREITDALSGLGPGLDRACSWITQESRRALDMYLAVALERIGEGHAAEGPADPALAGPSGDAAGRALVAAGEIAEVLEPRFGGAMGGNELLALASMAASCRSKSAGPATGSPGGGGGTRLGRLEGAAFLMIEAFDPELAPALKLDCDLVGGLASHMRPALARIETRMELADPLLDQVAGRHPELMAKSSRALAAAAGPDGILNESEVSFVAMHFGAAMTRLEERGARRRTLLVGIVCVNGIGTSYMLAAQVKKRFAYEAIVEVSGWEGREEWERYDLLVSTAPLEGASVPVILVGAFLDDRSTEKIREAISRLSSSGRAGAWGGGGSLAARCAGTEALLADARAVLEGFAAIEVRAGCSFAELAEAAAGFAAGPSGGGGAPGPGRGDPEAVPAGKPANAAVVLRDLMERELVSSQVIPELGVVLLHALTAGVDRPVFALAFPGGGAFADPYFKGAKACVLMLLPPSPPSERSELMGSFSAALVGADGLLDAVLRHDLKGARACLEAILEAYLDERVAKEWKK